MRITHFTPGTGHFYCGSCLRDNDLVCALRERGHDVTMVPLYLPFALEDAPHLPEDPVFLGGVNMYLQQKLPLLGRLPRFLTAPLDSPRLLRWLSSKGDMTDAAAHAAMTLSTLKGESGRQAAEFARLTDWVEHEPAPDVICLSNIMLIGLARRLKEILDAPIVCSVQGEAPFLDSLPEPYRTDAWETIAERAGDIDAFVPVSRHYGELVQSRLGFDVSKMHVVHCGIPIDEASSTPRGTRAPVIGYLARMCPDKGLHTLVDAFIRLKKESGTESIELHVMGVLLDADHAYFEELRARLESEGLGGDIKFSPNASRERKLEFLRSISVLSVPATYGESFGLYVLEALAHGVPVVQPRHGAFPEVLALLGGGRLCEPDDPASLATELRTLLEDEDAAAELAERGRRRVLESFTADTMARAFENVCKVVAE